MGVGPGTYRGEAGLEGGDDAGGGLGLVANLLDEGVLQKTKISSISGDSQKKNSLIVIPQFRPLSHLLIPLQPNFLACSKTVSEKSILCHEPVLAPNLLALHRILPHARHISISLSHATLRSNTKSIGIESTSC